MLLEIPGIDELTDAERERVGSTVAWAIRVSRAKVVTRGLAARLDAALVALVGAEPCMFSETVGVWSCYGRVTGLRVVAPPDVVALFEEWERARTACFERSPT